MFDSSSSDSQKNDDKGRGKPPPLDGAPWVVGPAERLIRIVLHGVKGRMVVAGKEYNREMPGFGRVLSNSEVSAVATYVWAPFGSSNFVLASRRTAGVALVRVFSP